MAVKLRLRREGTKKKPHYRVVVADSRSPRDGRFIEIIGDYHPMRDPSLVEIDGDRALYWLRNGAQPTSSVKKLLRISGVWAEFAPDDAPQRDRPAAVEARRKAAAAQRDDEVEGLATQPRPQPAATADAATGEAVPAAAGNPPDDSSDDSSDDGEVAGAAVATADKATAAVSDEGATADTAAADDAGTDDEALDQPADGEVAGGQAPAGDEAQQPEAAGNADEDERQAT